MSIEQEKPIMTARRLKTNIFSEELLKSMKTLNQLKEDISKKNFGLKRGLTLNSKRGNSKMSKESKSKLIQRLSMKCGNITALKFDSQNNCIEKDNKTQRNKKTEGVFQYQHSRSNKTRKFFSMKSKSKDCMLNIANEKGLESNANEYHKESFIIGKLSKLSSCSEESVSVSENKETMPKPHSPCKPLLNQEDSIATKTILLPLKNVKCTSSPQNMTIQLSDSKLESTNRTSSSPNSKLSRLKIFAQSKDPYKNPQPCLPKVRDKVRIMSPPAIMKFDPILKTSRRKARVHQRCFSPPSHIQNETPCKLTRTKSYVANVYKAQN